MKRETNLFTFYESSLTNRNVIEIVVYIDIRFAT